MQKPEDFLRVFLYPENKLTKIYCFSIFDKFFNGKKMSRIIFYLILKPLSLLPLSVLFYLSDFLYLLIYKLAGYRKNVVFTNLRNSFPKKTETEILDIARKFYHHFCDMMVESLKIFSISAEEAVARCRALNPEIIEDLFQKNKSVIVVCGHYNNWELAAVSFDLQVPHQVVGIYAPLANKFYDKKFFESRSQFGVELLPRRRVKSFFNENSKRLTCTVFGADQSPTSRTKKMYWTKFLNQDTAVVFGPEKYSVEYNYPVVFMRIKKVKRGYYEYTFEILEENPLLAKYTSISEKHTRWLEKQILEEPQYWLWTHRRWKRKRKNNE